MQLSPHFTLAEFTVSDTACKLRINNLPGPEEIARLRLLCTRVLQPLRDRVGPLRITSGYRAPAVNEAVGGARGSQHVLGEAADFVPLRCPRDYAFGVLAEMVRSGRLSVDQAITYGELEPHVHVSYTERRDVRNTLLLCVGSKRYVPWEPWE